MSLIDLLGFEKLQLELGEQSSLGKLRYECLGVEGVNAIGKVLIALRSPS
jgi:hypothetical protein